MSINLYDIQSPNYSKNSDRIKGDYAPCAICGKAVTSLKAKYVHIHGGGELIVTRDEAEFMDPAADCGGWPIGPECVRQHPELKPYLSD